jgi:hypothetical protein
MLLILVLGAYLSFRAFVLFAREGTKVNKSGFILDLNNAGNFTPQSMGFDFAFGTQKYLDP